MSPDDTYDLWGGNDAESAAGRQLRDALIDAMRVFGPEWPDRLASLVSALEHEPETLRLLATLLDEHAVLWDRLADEVEEE